MEDYIVEVKIEDLNTLNIAINSSDRYVCSVCNKSFDTLDSIKKHIKYVHSDTRKYKCYQCGKEFKTKGNLNEHIRYIHSDIKEYKCDQCSKEFKTKGN